MGFSQKWMNTLFDGQDKALVVLFVETLKSALGWIEKAEVKQGSDEQVLAELNKILRTAKYLGIETVADLVAGMVKKISANSDNWKNKIDIDLIILKQIVMHWGSPLIESSPKQLQDERALLAEYGREDAELRRIYLDLLINNMQKIREKINRLNDGKNLIHLLSELKEDFVTLDAATNFMNYPELSVIIREWLITVGNRVNENEAVDVNGISAIYNSLVASLRIQFSTNENIQTICKEIELTD